MDLRSRVQKRLDSLQINAREACRRGGLEETFVRDILNGTKKTVRRDNLVRLAYALECSCEYLSGDSDDVGNPPKPAAGFIPDPTGRQTPPIDNARAYGPQFEDGLPFGGFIEAGTFRRVDMLPAGRTIPAPPIAGHPDVRQVAFIVRGPCLDQIGIRENMIAVGYEADDFVRVFGGIPEDAIAVVRRTRDNRAEAELSIGVVRYFADRVEVQPRSSNPAARPVILPRPSTGDADEPRIVAIVKQAVLAL